MNIIRTRRPFASDRASRFVAIACFAALCAFAMAGCGGGDPEPEEGPVKCERVVSPPTGKDAVPFCVE